MKAWGFCFEVSIRQTYCFKGMMFTCLTVFYDNNITSRVSTPENLFGAGKFKSFSIPSLPDIHLQYQS